MVVFDFFFDFFFSSISTIGIARRLRRLIVVDMVAISSDTDCFRFRVARCFGSAGCFGQIGADSALTAARVRRFDISAGAANILRRGMVERLLERTAGTYG